MKGKETEWLICERESLIKTIDAMSVAGSIRLTKRLADVIRELAARGLYFL